ncbi:MAG: esterase/lipase family protein [Planctomycetota bacterium]|jgi:hypothetical protein
MNPVLIVHGWSDNSKSFQRLADYIRQNLRRTVEQISLADWISLNDDVTFNDLRFAMNRAWNDAVSRGVLNNEPRSVDVIVHSTGSLVVRDWMTQYFNPESNPIHRFLMLAPANFGSPLAHKGRAWHGRLLKGQGAKFETGFHILKGLELASPYIWELAERDLLARGERRRWYGQGRILATCLVGNSPYGGISGAISEDGSDGTVRVAGANPNTSLFSIRVASSSDGILTRTTQRMVDSLARPNRIAFTKLPGENHSTVTFRRVKWPATELTRVLVTDALQQSDDTWDVWCDRLEYEHAQATANPHPNDGDDAHFHGYQDTIVRVRDQFGQPVSDYVMEFKTNDRDSNRASNLFARWFQREVIQSVHPHSDDASYRSIYVDVSTLQERIDQPGESLLVGLTASPVIERRSRLKPSDPVGFLPLTGRENGPLQIEFAQIGTVFAKDRTTLIDIQIERLIHESVFSIR